MPKSLRWGIVLGFALGGFFDGILLHQILQWHHLLSLVPGVDTIRAQVLWDGYFHALMYLVAAVGLWGLWRSRGELQDRRGRSLPAALLIGFGAWHVIDGVLSHWLLGIHRIRLDSPDPLLWDLVWFAAFGMVPLVIGWWLLRRPPTRGGGLPGSALVLLVSLATTGAALWSLQPPRGQQFTTIVFAPHVRPSEAMNALLAADARLVWSDPAMGVIVAEVPDDRRLAFYRRGALLVGGSGVSGGCFNWSTAAV